MPSYPACCRLMQTSRRLYRHSTMQTLVSRIEYMKWREDEENLLMGKEDNDCRMPGCRINADARGVGQCEKEKVPEVIECLIDLYAELPSFGRGGTASRNGQSSTSFLMEQHIFATSVRKASTAIRLVTNHAKKCERDMTCEEIMMIWEVVIQLFDYEWI